MKRGTLREIEWGTCAGEFMNKTAIYQLGHIEPMVFLETVRGNASLDTPQDIRDSLEASSVQHLRLRPMSPSEAKSWGCDSGVMEAQEGRGYQVTAVIV